MEFNSKMNERTMYSIHNYMFWTKRPFCLHEIGYTYIQKSCLTCGRLFSIKEHQYNEHMKMKRLKE